MRGDVGVPIAGELLWNGFHNCPIAIATPERGLNLNTAFFERKSSLRVPPLPVRTILSYNAQ